MRETEAPAKSESGPANGYSLTLRPARLSSTLQLRARWTQENFFKYMREEFALDTLANYRLEEVDADERVVNPDWRLLHNAVLRRRRLALEKRGSERAGQLQARIQSTDRHIEGLQMVRRDVGRRVRAGDLDERQRLQALTHPLRDLLDAVRMIAYRAETRLAAAVAPGLSRPDAGQGPAGERRQHPAGCLGQDADAAAAAPG